MPDLLLELFSEEIPARMQEQAAQLLLSTLTEQLHKAGFDRQDGESFVTPRRLAVRIKNLPAAQPSSETELKGPKVGAPDAAMQGFLKKNNLTPAELTTRDGVYFAVIRREGRPTADLLKEIIEGILKNFPWPKSMRWGSRDESWVRPLHSILCLFDGKVVPVEFAGVQAGNVTRGHRYLSPGEIVIRDPGEYEAALEEAQVLADRELRKDQILAKATEAAAARGVALKQDDGLLEEVTGLVEWPVVLIGQIDAPFMDLPPEVLTTVMRSHQKYFSLLTADGALAPYFLIVANMAAEDGGKAIIAGNERVLRARFSDARFFWDQDRKKPLSDWAQGLKDVTFHAKLGSIADKVERVKALSRVILSEAKNLLKEDPLHALGMTERAVALCKADLVTGMVGEFAELQGIMGRYYALAQGEAPEVADAIRDHYLPLGPSSPVPTQPVSICIALADKLDTLIAMFAIGEKPTGSKDPFALRRAALGIIRIILENNIRLPLKCCFVPPAKDIALHKAHDKLVRQTEAQLHGKPHKVGKYLTVSETASQDIDTAVPPDLARTLYDFLIDRLKVQLKDSGIRHDVINAVVAGGDDDLVRIVARAKALRDFLGSDDGINLLVAYRRAANILAIEEKKDKTAYAAADLNPQALVEKEEKELAALLEAQAPRIENLRANEQFVEAMQLLAELRAPVDRFFDKIMVNCDDRTLRANRLRLLARIRDGMDSIASFAAIEG